MKNYFSKLDLNIKEALTPLYSSHAFNPEKNFNGFAFENRDGLQNVFIGPSAERSNSISYSPTFKVFNRAIESLKAKLLGDIEIIGGTILMQTQGQELAERYEVSGYENWISYQIKDQSDVDKMVNHHWEFMDKVGWNFLAQTTDIKGINEFLNSVIIGLAVENLSQEEKAKFVRQKGTKWMINGVISAWLANDSNLDKIISNYRSVYFPEHVQKIFNQLIVALEKNRIF